MKNLGKGNQIWITTHSTALINSVDSASLFRLSDYSGSNQIVKIIDDDSRIDLIHNIVGSKSILTLGEKIVFIEGIERGDKAILERWFDDIKNNISFVSANSVNNIYKLNNATLSLLHSSTKYTYFFCLRDRDFLSEEDLERETNANKDKIFIWNKYHIENFLINREAIFNVSKNIFYDSPFKNSEDILSKMKELVKENENQYVNKLLDYELHKQFKITNNLAIKDTDDCNTIQNKIDGFKSSLDALSKKAIKLSDLRQEKISYFEKLLEDGTWMDILPGKTILQTFHNRYMKNQIKFEGFKNLIVEEIKRIGIPSEVKNVISKIQNSH